MGGGPGWPTAAATTWGDDYWAGDVTFTSQRGSGPRTAPFHRTVDQRGAFVAVLSLLLLLGCALPYYRVVPTGAVTLVGPHLYKVVDAAFGSWRIALPALAALTAIFGVADSILRVGSRGAVGVLVTLRLLALVQLALWVLVVFDHQMRGAASGAAAGPLAAPAVTVMVTWVAWAAAAAAAVALAGSFASMSKSRAA